MDESGAVTDEQAFTAYNISFWANNGFYPNNLNRGGYQDGETGLDYAGGGDYYQPGTGSFNRPFAPGYTGGNPYNYQPNQGEEAPDGWVLGGLDGTSDMPFYRRPLHQTAEVAKQGLLFASKFNPLCQLSEAAFGQDASGARISKVERFLSGANAVLGPLGKLLRGSEEGMAAVRAARNLSQADSRGSVALGLGKWLPRFANQMGSKYYKDFPGALPGTFDPAVFANAMNEAGVINFNLTGSSWDRYYAWLGKGAKLSEDNFTNWELYQVLNNSVWKDKCQFWRF